MMRTFTAFVSTLLLIGYTLIGYTGTAFAQDGPPGVQLPPGYTMEPVVTGLDYPTGIAFSGDKIWVSEAGQLPGLAPKVKEANADGQVTTLLTPDMLPQGTLVGPLIDVTFHNGMLWISHRQKGVNDWNVGAISKFDPADPAGTFTTVITNLPASGDHHTNEIVFDSEGRAYFSQGTATNSGVVGPDNFLITGWLEMFPDFHGFPAKDITLNGTDFQPPVGFPLDPDSNDVTGPYMPYGSGPVSPGAVVEGATPDDPQEGIIAGNGTVYSFDPSASDPASTLRLEAWGLRNPFGVGLDPMNSDRLFASNNGADTRGRAGETSVPIEEFKLLGQRPIEEDYDDLFAIDIGGAEEFFGFPDFFHNEESGAVQPVTDPIFCGEEDEMLPDCPGFVLAESFRNSLDVQPAFAQVGYHTSANKFGFSTSEAFGFSGDLFVTETGSFVPITGAEQFAGYKVVRVNRETGQVSNFIVNAGSTPEELLNPESFNKPIDAKFRGEELLLVDFGVFEPALGGEFMQAGTGKVWMVSPSERGPTTTFEVTVENVSTPGLLNTDRAMGTVPLSPGAFAVFQGEDPAFTPGEMADSGTRLIGEDGFPSPQFSPPDVPADATETAILEEAPNAAQVGDFASPGGTPDVPALFPGETATFTVEAAPGDRLQLETMFVQSNDWFFGFTDGGLELFDGDDPISGDVTGQLGLYDAGTEEDTPPGTGPDQKPVQAPTATDVGPDEQVAIQLARDRHPDFTIPSNDAVIRVTIAPVSEDQTPPVCGTIEIERDDQDRLAAVETSVTDAESGIASVAFTRLRNLEGFAGGNGPFTQGDTYTTPEPNPTTVAIRGERLDFNKGGAILTTVTNGAGLTAKCDPAAEQLASVPEAFALEGNYPNPFSGETTIGFRIAEKAPVRVEVYDVLGRKVATLVDGEELGPGSYQVSWEAEGVASGTYVYRIEAGGFEASRSMTVVK